MSASTVKLDGELLRAIAIVKPPKQALSAYLRAALQRDLRRQQMRNAAEAYMNLLRTNVAEREAMDEGEAAPLATSPRAKNQLRYSAGHAAGQKDALPGCDRDRADRTHAPTAPGASCLPISD